jgi:hypothetical protein
LYHYEAEFIKKLIHEKNKPFVVAFSSTLRFIDDVLSIDKEQFHAYVGSIQPGELEIKDITESSTSTSYLDVSLKLDTGGKLTIQLYDKRGHFCFARVNLPYI